MWEAARDVGYSNGMCMNHIYIRIIYLPNLGLTSAVLGKEREQSRFTEH